jgi:hypothetical protein
MTAKKLSILLPLVVVVYLSFYVLPINIQGDGFRHASYAREIAKEGVLLENTPHQINDVEDGVISSYFPLPYPQTPLVMFGLIEMVGGDTLLKLISPLMGALVALVIFLILRDINKYVGFFAALGALVLCSRRFIMVPLLEQPLLVAGILAIFCYYNFFKTDKLRYILLAGLFLGLSMVTKQQGYILAAMVVLHALAYFGYKAIELKKLKVVVPVIVMFVVLALVAIGPLCDLFQRTGTIGFSPGTTTISKSIPFHSSIESFLSSKFPTNEEAEKALDQQLDYGLKNVSALDIAEQYLLSPTFFGHEVPAGFLSDVGRYFLIAAFGVLFLLGCGYLFKKARWLFSLVLTVFVGEFFAATVLEHHVYQYYVISLSVLSAILVCGLFHLLKGLVQKGPVGRLILTVVLLFLAVTSAIGYAVYILPELGDEGRQTDYYLDAYKELGYFVKENTPEDAIFLNSSVNFACFAERDFIWLDFGGGAKVPTIFKTEDSDIALHWLEYYGIDYIVIDMGQTERGGLYDYIPPHGLLDYIDTSPHFRQIYHSDDEVLRLYMVLYDM